MTFWSQMTRICRAMCAVTLSAATTVFFVMLRFFIKVSTARMAGELTLRFRQEIYDDQGRLVEIHEEYPLYMGHRKA